MNLSNPSPVFLHWVPQGQAPNFGVPNFVGCCRVWRWWRSTNDVLRLATRPTCLKLLVLNHHHSSRTQLWLQKDSTSTFQVSNFCSWPPASAAFDRNCHYFREMYRRHRRKSRDRSCIHPGFGTGRSKCRCDLQVRVILIFSPHFGSCWQSCTIPVGRSSANAESVTEKVAEEFKIKAKVAYMRSRCSFMLICS